MRRPNNLPLPTLPLSKKLGYTSALATGYAVFLGTWLYVFYALYWVGGNASNQELGVRLGVLAQRDAIEYWQLFALHLIGLVLTIGASLHVFSLTSIQRKVRQLIVFSCALVVLIDVIGWLYAPSCSSTNHIVGYLGFVSTASLSFLVIAPLFQMFVFARWDSPTVVRVVVVGGGFGGMYTALSLNKTLGYNQQLEIYVLDKNNYFLFPPLLPSAASGAIETRQVSFPFRRIFETTNVIFRKTVVSRIDPDNQVVFGQCDFNRDASVDETRPKEVAFSYDYLVLAPGSQTQTFGVPGVKENAIFMRVLDDAITLRNRVIELFERASVLEDIEDQKRLLHFLIIGAGPTGVETATEIQDLIHKVLLKRYPEIHSSAPKVSIIQSGETVLPGWDKSIRFMTLAQLKRLGIEIQLGERVSGVGDDHVMLRSGTKVDASTVVWCSGVKPAALVERSGLPKDVNSGAIPVENDLRVAAYPNVFVLGDAALCIDPDTSKPYPALAQVALQQGKYLGNHLGRLIRGMPTQPFRYFDYGGLVSVGEYYAAVNLKGLKLSGFIGWLVWRGLYLVKLPELSNKVRILVDWVLDLLIERSISQIRTGTVPTTLEREHTLEIRGNQQNLEQRVNE